MPTNITFGSVSLRAYGYTLGSTVYANNSFLTLIVPTAGGVPIPYKDFSISGVELDGNGGATLYAPMASWNGLNFTWPFTTYRVVVNSDGSVQSAKQIAASGTSSTGFSVVSTKDSSNNTWLYTEGHDNAGANMPYLISLDSSGALGVTKLYGTVYSSAGYGARGISVDSSGNIWVVHTYNNYNSCTYAYNTLVIWGGSLWSKYDSTGTLINTYQSNSNATISLTTPAAGSLTTDSAGNVIIAATTLTYGCGGFITAFTGNVIKFPSATPTTLTWSFSFPANTIAWGVGTDSSNNVYAFGTSSSSPGTTAYLVKYNAAGTIQWQKTWTISVLSYYYSNVAFDASGNVYVAYTGTNANGYCLYIAKFDSAGAPIFFRTLSTTTSGYGVYGGASGSSLRVSGSYIYVSGTFYTGGSGAMAFVFKVPTDGSLTQSFSVSGITGGAFSYATATVTVSNATGFVNATAGGTRYINTLSNTTLTATIADVSSTSGVKVIT